MYTQSIRYNFHLNDWYPKNVFNICNLESRKLAMASAPLELAWLHHEFCKFLIDIQRFDLARFYAKKGRDIAQEAAWEEWVLNIDHLILRLEIHQNNRNEAREVAVLALVCARKLGIDYLVKIKFHNFATTRAPNNVATLRSNSFHRSIPILHIIFKLFTARV